MVTEVQNLSGYVIGEHLSHTFSPQIHSYLADYSYSVKELKTTELEAFIKNKNFDFLNVTIPYKKAVIPFLSYLSDEAKEIGAVNTVKKNKDGTLVGYNTDYYGFGYTLKKSGIVISGKKVLVLGSGGASLPVKAVLKDSRANEIVTISRNGENNYENLYLHSNADVIINTTPVGMYPNNGLSPIDLSLFPKCSGVIDIIYNPQKTALLLQAEKKGILHIGGLDMLVAQAKRAAEISTECEIPEKEIDIITKKIAFQMNNIILIGMPGCGKTTVGKLLSELTGKHFYDSDDEFTKEYGTTPAEAIQDLGEERFREMEHRILIKLGSMSNSIIATGGGAVTRNENYSPLHQNGRIFFIERELKKLSILNRPISQRIGVEELYKVRYPLYMSFCDHKIVSDENQINTANKIYNIFKAEFEQ